MMIATALAAGACSDGGPIVVRTVYDRTGTPAAGVRVQVEELPWATTGEDGTATFAPRARPFTVRVHQFYEWIRGDQASDYVYVLRGRTGNVLAEVEGTTKQPGWHEAQVQGTVGGRLASSSSAAAVRLPYRINTIANGPGADGSFDLRVEWQGKSSASIVLRAWEADTLPPEAPSRYYGFGSATVPVVEGGSVTGVSLSLAPVTQGTVEGLVSLPPALLGTDVRAALWLVFAPYDWLYLAGLAAPGRVAAVVPSVAGAEAWIGVFQVDGTWHNRRVAVPSSGVVFDIPARPELIEPADQSVLGDATVFRWSPPEAGGTSTLSVRCDWVSFASPAFRSINYSIEADGSETTLPAIPDVAIPPGATCRWTVQWCAATDRALEERCSGSLERHLTH